MYLDKERIALMFAGIVGSQNIKTDEPMKNHTSFKVGGPADVFVIPDSMDSLIKVHNICIQEQLPVFVMGNGTNLIVRDKGIRGVVIKVLDYLSKYEVIDDTIKVESGILLSRLSRIALEYGLSGLEFAEGIPGTLGGAVTMNAGAYTGEMADVVVSSKYMDRYGRVMILGKERHQFGKRASFIQNDGGIILTSDLKLKRSPKEGIKLRMDDFNKQRREKQPLDLPSAGSIFKRPEGYFAGKLVQDCGLKGFRMGGAEVSGKHCGFIVNADSASASDVTGLIKYIQDVVKEKFCVELHTEVKFVGEE